MLERTLQDRFAGVFRRIWVSYTRLNSLQVIAFPIGTYGQYRIFTRKNTPIFRWVKSEDGQTETRMVDIDIIERFIRDEIDAQGSGETR